MERITRVEETTRLFKAKASELGRAVAACRAHLDNRTEHTKGEEKTYCQIFKEGSSTLHMALTSLSIGQPHIGASQLKSNLHGLNDGLETIGLTYGDVPSRKPLNAALAYADNTPGFWTWVETMQSQRGVAR